jgi:hypothetical protein
MKMTWKKLLAWIAAGYGQGHGNDYKSFLQITRRNTTDKSNQSAGRWLYGYTREFNYMSRAERLMAMVLIWLGAVDVREQYPFWPVPHPHPLDGVPGAEHLMWPEAPGLLDLARQAGIDHGVFVGSTIPYIATMDLMATVWRGGAPRIIAVPCKPFGLIEAADAASTMLARMELERLYCNAVEIPRRVADVAVLGKDLVANLSWFMPDMAITTELRTDPKLHDFRDLLSRHIHSKPIDRTVADAATQVDWPASRATAAFNLLAWRQDIDVDLSRPVALTQPARAGGIAIRNALQHNILGEVDHVPL